MFHKIFIILVSSSVYVCANSEVKFLDANHVSPLLMSTMNIEWVNYVSNPNISSKEVMGSIPKLTKDIIKPVESADFLYFFDNDIEEIDVEVFKNMNKLKLLALVRTKLEEFPANVLDGLPLKGLQISENSISRIKRGTFGKLPHLVYLDLSVNQITSIEEKVFENLTSLSQIILASNLISHLPADIFRSLPNLQRVVLYQNKFQEIEVGVFGNTTIGHLNLGGNSISEIPVGFAQNMPNLWRLQLTSNNLTAIRKGLFNNHRKLQQIELDNNAITHIDTEAFGNMPHLANLLLSSNKLTEINPNWFHNSTFLFRLFLGNNLLRNVPAEAFKNIYKAKKPWIKLTGNQIETISDQAFKGLGKIHYLDMGNNQLGSWSEKLLEHVEEINYLNLVYNKIHCPDGDFDSLFKANTTYLSGNPLSRECRDRIKKWKLDNKSKIVEMNNC